MANVGTQGVFLPNYLNACNSPSVTGAADPVAGAAIPTGLYAWKTIELSFAGAQALQAPAPSIEQLYDGFYTWVQVDSGAIQSEINTGLAAYYKIDTGSNNVQPIGRVTGETGKTAVNLWAGVFINPITAGNWGFIFTGGGRVNVQYKSSLTNGGAAIGDVVEVGGGGGTFDDTSATAVTSKSIGIAVVKPVNNGTSPIYCRYPFYRIAGLS